VIERADAGRELRLSLALLATIVVFALIGLATDRNWPKILRVSSAFVTYAAVLLTLLHYRRGAQAVVRAIPFAWFIGAGAAAGLVSGLVRPEVDVAVVVAGTIGAALLLAGVHCLALRMISRTRSL
jgi:hypothetical protein